MNWHASDFPQLAERSVRDVIDAQAAERPNSVFLINPENGETITYGQLQTKVKSVAKSIQSMGVKKGEAVAYAFNNSPESAVAILGIFYGGYIATAINLVAGNETISYVLEHSESKLIFTDTGNKDLFANKVVNKQSVQTVLLQDLNRSAEEYEANTNANDDALLMYTSGTTGRPKGVVHTQLSLLSGGMNTVLAHKLTANDRGLCVLPFYHINGLCVTLIGTLISGGGLIVPPKFSVSKFWEMLKENNGSWFSVVPTQISYLLHDNLDGKFEAVPTLRFGRSASAPLAPDVQKSFESRFNVPIVETMGLTETAAQILSNPLPPGVRKIGSPGIGFGNEIKIANTNREEMPVDQEGEILVRGPNVMKGYLKNNEATGEALRDGWLCTGDLGKMDKDGYVFVTGRLKELIIKGGENIAPREVDEALYSHPDVIEAAAFSMPCNQYGERVEAAVKLQDGTQLTNQALLEICHEKIGKFKSPDKVHILADLPKGPSGKIQRRKLCELIG